MSDKKKLETVVTPAGIAKYPRLNSPDTKFNPEGDYKITLVLNKKEKGVPEFLKKLESLHAQALRDAQAAAKKGKKVKAAESPIKAHVDDDGNEVAGSVEISAKMKASGKREDGTEWTQRPAIFDAFRKPATVKVGAGSKVKVSVELNPYNSPSLGAGLSLRLKAVQVIDLVEFSGEKSAAGYGFEEEEGGFSAEDSEGADDSESGEDTGDDAGDSSDESAEDETVPEGDTPASTPKKGDF